MHILSMLSLLWTDAYSAPAIGDPIFSSESHTKLVEMMILSVNMGISKKLKSFLKLGKKTVGLTSFSMKNDFKTICGARVLKLR